MERPAGHFALVPAQCLYRSERGAVIPRPDPVCRLECGGARVDLSAVRRSDRGPAVPSPPARSGQSPPAAAKPAACTGWRNGAGARAGGRRCQPGGAPARLEPTSGGQGPPARAGHMYHN